MSTSASPEITDASDVETPQKVPVFKVAVVVAVVLTAILEVLDTTIINVALPYIKSAFGITSDQITWILTSYIVAAVIVMPLTGLFSRKFGRRRLISTAIIGFTCFSVLCGLSWSIESMVFFRIGQGLFGAFLIPLSQSILFDCFPKEKKGQAMAMFGLGVVVAPILGPTIGAILTEYFSWRAVFYVNLPIAAIALIMITGELESDDTKEVKIDWYGLILMMVAIGALQMMLDEGVRKNWFSSHFIQICAFLAVTFGTFFAWRGWSNKDNIVDLQLLKDHNFAAANITMLGFGLGMYGTIAMLPLFVQGLLGYPVMDAGFLFIPRGIAAGITMISCGAFLLRLVDARILVLIGLVLTGLGNFMLAWLNLDASFWNIAWPGVVSGVGMGLFFVSMTSLAFQNIEQAKQDEASGIFGVMRSLGSSIGIAIVSWQFATRLQYHWSVLSKEMPVTGPEVHQYLSKFNLSPSSAEGVDKLTEVMAAQVQMLAFQDVFAIAGWAALIMIPFIFFMTKPPEGSSPAAAH